VEVNNHARGGTTLENYATNLNSAAFNWRQAYRDKTAAANNINSESAGLILGTLFNEG